MSRCNLETFVTRNDTVCGGAESKTRKMRAAANDGEDDNDRIGPLESGFSRGMTRQIGGSNPNRTSLRCPLAWITGFDGDCTAWPQLFGCRERLSTLAVGARVRKFADEPTPNERCAFTSTCSPQRKARLKLVLLKIQRTRHQPPPRRVYRYRWRQ